MSPLSLLVGEEQKPRLSAWPIGGGGAKAPSLRLAYWWGRSKSPVSLLSLLKGEEQKSRVLYRPFLPVSRLSALSYCCHALRLVIISSMAAAAFMV